MSAPPMHAHWITASGREGAEGDAEALFPWWSFGKTVIAACALRLVEDGRLELDARCEGGDWTLRQLLAHRAGLPDYGPFKAYHDAVAAGEAPWPRQKLWEVALSKGMFAKPGQDFCYSNLGYMLIREQIEAVTGMGLGAVVNDSITGPLGLEQVSLAETPEAFEATHWEMHGYDPRWVYHGCLIGTAREAAVLLQALVAGKILSRPSLDAMLERRVLGGALEGRPWTVCGYGLGVMTGEVGAVGRAIGHSGAGPFCVNAVYHFPDGADPITVACFNAGQDEGVSEFAATRIAGCQSIS